MAEILVTDSESALVSSVSQKIDSVKLKNCLFHYESNVRQDFNSETHHDLESNINFYNLYICCRNLPFLPTETISGFLDFLKDKFSSMIFYPNYQNNTELQKVSVKLIEKYAKRFENHGSRLSWYDVISESEGYVDLTQNTLERSNQEFRKSITLSHKRRIIDRIMVLKDYIFFRSLDFLNNFDSRKKRVSDDARRNYQLRKEIVDQLESDENDFQKIYEIFTGDRSSA